MTAAMRPSLPRPIGAAEPRAKAKRLAAGRGRYADDVSVANMLHAAFLRSPYAHARIRAVDTAAALAVPGVAAVFTGRDVAALCRPWQGNHALFPDLKSPPQYPLAVEVARWQGEAVAMVLADSRAEAEDAAALIEVDWEELPAVADGEGALAAGSPRVHPDLPGNLALDRTVAMGDAAAVLANAAHVVEQRYVFGRHTGVTLELRAILAEYDPTEERLVVTQSHQAPHQQQDLFARLLGLDEQNVRVICPDVGGGFGLKLQLYADEAAVVLAAKALARPVKYVADRIEAFAADIHARDHIVTARMGFDDDGRILAYEVDDIFPIGPYSQYPRASVTEGSHIMQLTGAPYRLEAYRARSRMVYQNKGMVGHYRSVGHPIACAVAETLVDAAARRLDLDPLEMRRRNYLGEADWPHDMPSGFRMTRQSFHECLDMLERRMDIPALRAEQAALRPRGVWRGIGVAGFVELTGPGPDYYGKGGIRVAAQDGCVVKLEPSGKARVFSSATDQGQGTDVVIAQIVAAMLGLATADVRVVTGDSETCPYGGGAFASRGVAISGEAALRAAKRLRENVLAIAGTLLQMPPSALDLADGHVVEIATGARRFTLAEVGRIGTFEPYLLPKEFQSELTVAAHYVQREQPFDIGNGIQGCHLEVDVETGIVRLLRHWAVIDCGRIMNPLLIDEQVRGGVVLGLGGALYEESIYDRSGQLLNASMADYLVPMAAEMPDIDVAHVDASDALGELGAKGVGENGAAGATGAVLCAINDALAPLGAVIAETPATPARILRAIRLAAG